MMMFGVGINVGVTARTAGVMHIVDLIIGMCC